MKSAVTTVLAAAAAMVLVANGQSFDEVLPSGCCRNSDGESTSGPKTYLFSVTREECEAACAASSVCLGYEYKEFNLNCELYQFDSDFARTNGVSACRCFRRVFAPTTDAPTNAPTPPPTPAPTSLADFACAGVTLGAGDTICAAGCEDSLCSCAVNMQSIPAGESCTSRCASFGMTCVGRHSDGPSQDQCRYFNAGTRSESCDAVGDNDDVCVCGRPSPSTAEACADIAATLSGDETVCGGHCDGDACYCAAAFDAIPNGGSCTTVCEGFGMACVGRHSDGPSGARACEYFGRNERSESCDATGDGDDVCVCSRAQESESAAQVELVSPSTTTFNPLTAGSFVFQMTGGEFRASPIDALIIINEVVINQSSIAVDGANLNASAAGVLRDGRNTVFLSATTTDGDLVSLNVTVWAGDDSTTTVSLLNGTDLYTLPADVVASLSDDPTVRATVATTTGVAVFDNLPSRTIVFRARGDDNSAGSTAALGGTVSVAIQMAGFNPPSVVDNNDFSGNLSGWDVGEAPSATIVPHEEDVGPQTGNGTSTRRRRQLTPDGDDNDLCVTTGGDPFGPQGGDYDDEYGESPYDDEGSGIPPTPPSRVRRQEGGNGSPPPQKVSRTFAVSSSVVGILVRYRFVTSEVPGGFFGSRYNDYFEVKIRSQVAGGIHSEANSMNGLGLAAFDYATGSTSWRTVQLPLSCSGDVVQVDVTVANVADNLYHSAVYVDFVAVTTLFDLPPCPLGEEAQVVAAIGPIDTTLAYADAVRARDVAVASGLPGATDGPQDAYRHCVWNCLMANSIGADQAKEVGDLHESCNLPIVCPATAMDLHNNAVGRSLATDPSTSGTDCTESCAFAITSGVTQNYLPGLST